MTNSSKNLSNQLMALVASYHELDQVNAAQRRALDQRQSEIQNEMAILQTELSDLADQQRALQAAQQRIQREFTQQALQPIHVSLRAGNACLHAEIERTHAFYLAKQAFARMLADNTDLADDWNAYQVFEQTKDTILSSLPAFHKEQLIQSHHLLRQRLQKVIDMEVALRDAPSPPMVTLDVFVYRDSQGDDITFVLPIRMDNSHEPDEYTIRWNEIGQAFNAALFMLGKSSEWTIIEPELHTWSDYTALVALHEYRGDGPVLEALEAALNQGLNQQPLNMSIPLAVALHSLPPELWRAHHQMPWSVDPEATSADSEAEAPSDHEFTPEINAVTQVIENSELHALDGAKAGIRDPGVGWYTDDDIKAWLSPLRNAKQSKWSRPARQVRTLLVRMIARGHIGDQRIPALQLWTSLPATQAAQMRKSVEILLDHDLLITASTSPEDLATREIALNPARLDEAQNLINRTITPFWETLLNAV